ncbi:MAG TPA: right-handed parallel beta-helix repeat-containing protein [Candidatus Acidoferrum sp.]|nr:right-handed parallel beta-helix repeat-containing protein [Candidatus Acidoferrum sp.]
MIFSRLTIGILIALIALGSRISSLGSSRTYYVDSRAGSDANSGTSLTAPWKSLDKINATTFHLGDHILLKSSSVWHGQLWPKGSGAEGNPITLGMYGGGVKPQIDCDGLAEDAVLLKNQEYWEIEDLEITNTGRTPAVRRGVHLMLDNFGDAHHIYVRRLTIHDVNGSDQEKPNGGINYTSDGSTKRSRFVDLRIEDNQIYHVDRSGIFGWSDRWERSKWYPSLAVVVRGNVLSDIGGDGIVVVATDGALVENNLVGHANQRSEGYNVAIWPWSADNTVIQYNEAYGTKGQRDGEGFDSDWNARNTIIQYNYSHDNDGGFLLICNEGGLSADESAGNVGTIARYNISQNDRTRGINIAGPTTDTQIYNNTLYVGTGHNVNLTIISDWHGWARGTSLLNNVFYVDGFAQFSYALSRNPDGEYVVAPGAGPSAATVFDSNVYFGSVRPPDDPHALTGNPGFVAVGEGRLGRESLQGYRLKEGSPAIGSAMHIPHNGGRDFWGTALPPRHAPDRGASQSGPQ